MWNHPGWPDNKSTRYEVHERLIMKKKPDQKNLTLTLPME
jgi:hypothetical protein